MSLPRRCRAPWLAALAAIAFAAPAPVAAAAKAPHAPAAQAPQVDPNSPAGTEYQLPVDRAREQAGGGGSGGSTGTSSKSPLFGQGVGKADSGSGRGSAGGGADTSGSGARGGASTTTGADTGRSRSGGGGASTTTGAGTGRSRSGAGGGTGERPQLGIATPEILRSQAPAPEDGGGGLVSIAAGAVGVLLIGGLAGLAWRRRTLRG